MKPKTIRIGSRESRLAIAQTELVLHAIRRRFPETPLELVSMKTTGDRFLDKPLDQIGGKGVFVKELDAALREGKIDLAVHSLKDVPMETPPDLPLRAFFRRGDPRDALVLPLSPAAENTVIGSSSARRKLQLGTLFPHAAVEPIRGNLLTRLDKLERGPYTSLVLAAAGLQRLGLSHRISRVFSVDEILPAAGQGILAIQGRAGEAFPFLQAIHCPQTACTALAERAFVRALHGGCSSPVAAYAEISGQELHLRGLYWQEESGSYRIGTLTGEPEQAERLGEQLARQMQEESV